MSFHGIDYLVIAAFFAILLAIPVWANRRGAQGASDFFHSGRSMPWWLIGISMVAAMTSTNSANLFTQFIREDGLAGNWAWWSFLTGGVLTVFVYAKLWHRLGATTDIAFYELRYSGRPAAFLRGFRAVYLGVIYNLVVMATVLLGAVKLGTVLFDVPAWVVLAVTAVASVLYSTIGGIRGTIVRRLLPLRRHHGRCGRRHGLRACAAGRRRLGRAPEKPCRRAEARLLPGLLRHGHGRRRLRHPGRDPVVERLVPRLRAGRRRLHRPAHADGEERRTCARRHALRAGRAVRDPPLAVVCRRVRLARRLPRPRRDPCGVPACRSEVRRQRHGVSGDDQVRAGRLARRRRRVSDGGSVLHDCRAALDGRELRGARRLEALRPPVGGRA